MALNITQINNETWFKISNLDAMRPFLISLVSDSNHWMFISSNGGLSAGRKNAQYALFPYYTDDKLTELADTTGSKTIVQIHTAQGVQLWEPFSDRFKHQFTLSRNLYKNVYGNKIMFEEMLLEHGLIFRYEWNSSDKFGYVRRASLTNTSRETVKVTLLDGIQNIMPYGVSADLQQASSNLVDAYKRSELVADTGLGIYALSAIIVDKAEPSEALKANAVWSYGMENPNYLLSSLQLEAFRNKKSITPESDVKGEKGAYFLHKSLELDQQSSKSWYITANVNLNHAQIISLNEWIKSSKDIIAELETDIQLGTERLVNLIASSDGLQKTSDHLKDARHFSNTLFNIMRGGIFDDNYRIEKGDFSKYLNAANKEVAKRNAPFVNQLPATFTRQSLIQQLNGTSDADLIRLTKEYLPLKFSRRHGDPSRPWNKFSINTVDEVDGSKILDYEGNWRDIFQNWEALAHSYPDFMEGMIFKFLNASTFDGYNPYRVTKGGFDWETIEPDNPWSYIGYWGDHQIIYLQKFLEFYQHHNTSGFDAWMNEDVFVYANVPYRIKPYASIAKDPKNTIEFDEPSDHAIRMNLAKIGADGALLASKVQGIHHVNFMEKLLATVLAKVSNFIPEAGIWMNTQRPEWNDANNALVGNGVSMVTLCYLYRMLEFFKPVLSASKHEGIQVSEELAAFFMSVMAALSSNENLLAGAISDADRKRVTDALGLAGSTYREQIYDAGFTGKKQTLNLREIEAFVRLTNKFLAHSIASNRRADGLYHAYNLMTMTQHGVEVSHLSEMLEGQVAVLSSGYLNASEAADVLDALRSSALYRKDQNSYLLYPNKALPGFLQRNNIPSEAVESNPLLKTMVEKGHQQLITRDALGGYHFNGNFKNASDLAKALEALKDGEYAGLITKHEAATLNTFEKVFNHKAFTGRSGTFYGYEGLGSIYWHMVSKLYLAVQEVATKAAIDKVDAGIQKRLRDHFYEIAEGIGVHKSPEVYGAFPTDPYSHTPLHRGAQQPGMTGQVKEDLLARIGELGVNVIGGQLSFNPTILRKSEFTTESSETSFIGLDGKRFTLSLPAHSVFFSICQVPVVYTIATENAIKANLTNNSAETVQGLKMPMDLSKEVFTRSGKVKQITVFLKESLLI